MPSPIFEHHKNKQFYMDLFYVNGVPFIHIRSVKINFRSVQACVSRAKGKITKGLETVKKIYETRGFNITTYHGNNFFDIQVLRWLLLSGLLSICARDEHIHVIER